jgi:hypothetical protein
LLSVPIEIPSDFGALNASGLARKQGLEIGKPDVIAPSIGVIVTEWLQYQVADERMRISGRKSHGTESSGRTTWGPASAERTAAYNATSGDSALSRF